MNLKVKVSLVDKAKLKSRNKSERFSCVGDAYKVEITGEPSYTSSKRNVLRYTKTMIGNMWGAEDFALSEDKRSTYFDLVRWFEKAIDEGCKYASLDLSGCRPRTKGGAEPLTRYSQFCLIAPLIRSVK